MADLGPPGGEDARRSEDVDLPVAGVGDVVSGSEFTGEDVSAYDKLLEVCLSEIRPHGIPL